MGKKKSLWLESLTNSFAFMLGAVLTAAFSLNWFQKPSSQEIQASQKATMTVTAYSAEKFPGKTATGNKVRPGLDAAVSPDRLDLLGKKVYVKCGDKGLGIRIVTDIMDVGMANTLDILVPTEKNAAQFGKCADCTVIKLDN